MLSDMGADRQTGPLSIAEGRTHRTCVIAVVQQLQLIYHCEKSDGDGPAAGEVFVARAQVKKAGRTLTVSTADAFAIKGGKEKVVATMLATIMAVPITRAK